ITIDTLLGIENKKIEKLEESERIVLHKFRRLNEKNKIKAEERIDTLLDTQDEEEAKRKESA
ncbi:MAG: hypothetical protein J6I55_07305, partial [Ruminococcus sp.]|nr:hypothetical protein [Ruminococcus sp.]